VVASSSNRLLDGNQSGTQLPRIAMQRICTTGQVNDACGPRFWMTFDERKTLKKSQYVTLVEKFFIFIIIIII
jgi:hypothetical protein